MKRRLTRIQLMSAMSTIALATGCAPAATQVPAPATAKTATTTTTTSNTTAMTNAAIDALIERHFLVINAVEANDRAARMADAYSDDVSFFDPGEEAHGRAAVSKTLDHVHARFPGATFRREGAIQNRAGTLRVGWTLSQPGQGIVHRGEDVIRIDGGRVHDIWVYIQPEPQGAKPVFAGIDHAGLTVPNLAAATAFFHDVMGCEAMTSMGAFKTNDNWFREHLGVDPRAEVAGIAMLRCGYGSNIELLEYKDRTRREAQIGNSDIGAAHLAFYASDLKGAIAHLKRHGISTMGEPTPKTTGDTAGETFVYFRTPWGAQLELVSFPDGKAYEKDRQGVRLWSPLSPAE